MIRGKQEHDELLSPRLSLRAAGAPQHDGSVLSVIIPTLDCERSLVPTLASLVSGAAVGTVRDVIIADGGSRDATLTWLISLAAIS